MLWEDLHEQRSARTQFKLGLLGQNAEEIKARFPELFGEPTREVGQESTDQEIEEAIDQELAGASSEWVNTGEVPSEQEVTQLLQQLTQGTATVADLGDEEGWQ